MNTTLCGAAALVATALCAASASAHGAWIAPRHGDLAVVYGHGGSDDAYAPAKVTTLQGCDAAGVCADLPTRALEDHVELERPEGAPLIKLILDNGFWAENAEGEWFNKPKNEVEGAKGGGRYIKYATHVLEHLKGEAAPLGLKLEIVPLADPLSLHAGEELTVRVLKDGAPLSGAEVMIDYTASEETVRADADGVARVKLRNQGLNVLAVSATEDSYPDPEKADKTGMVSTLSFVLEHEE